MRHTSFLGIGAVVLCALGATRAEAVPAFAAQTGQACSACHVGGFGPQLTPFGRAFKLEGYTMRAGDTFTAPVSAMAMASYVHTNADQPPPAPHYAANDNTTLDQFSLFVAGGVGDHFGGFTQWTYDGVGRAVSWDNLDLRAVTHETIDGSDVLLGLSLNNSPTVQDVWNTTSAWGFPYSASDLVPAPAAATMLDGGFAQTTLGMSAYAWWDMSIYTEAGLYWTPGRGFLRAMNTYADDNNILNGVAPYFRAAYQKDYGDQNFELGAFAMFPDVYPVSDRSTGTSDRYQDVGVDASYQYVGDGTGIYQVNARYTHENQNLRASYLLGNAASRGNDLDDFRIDASYYWQNMIGGTIGAFDTTGSADSGLYAGNRTFKPDSSGFIFQVDYTPFGGADAPVDGRFNLRVGLQYYLYTRFNGASSNYDGLGHDASDNNAFRVFLWTAL
ncbi:MAG: cytochrome C [Proteobacteria bacterium]|nr:cytochrome C [Pseudomonadota bacterium]